MNLLVSLCAMVLQTNAMPEASLSTSVTVYILWSRLISCCRSMTSSVHNLFRNGVINAFMSWPKLNSSFPSIPYFSSNRLRKASMAL